jgi:hypothetical protein
MVLTGARMATPGIDPQHVFVKDRFWFARGII